MAKIVILNGTSSSGKTSLARAIQRLATGPVLRVSMDDGGRLTDATGIALDLTGFGGRGQIRLAFYDDGAAVDEILLKPADRIDYEAAAAFDEVVLSATGKLGFDIAGIDMARIEDDSFDFV